MVDDAKQYVAQVEALNRPCTGKEEMQWLSLRAGSFLCHYFIALTDQRLNALVAADWLMMLKEFPPHAIEKAIAHWIKTGMYKPKPSEIRELCIDFFPRVVYKNLERARHIATMEALAEKDGEKKEREWKPPTPEEKERVRAMMQKIGLKAECV